MSTNKNLSVISNGAQSGSATADDQAAGLIHCSMSTQSGDAFPEAIDASSDNLIPEPDAAEALDNAAVDRMASLMKDKLARSRAKGRDGWNNPDLCSVEFLADILIEHVPKGDPVDIANLAMMLQLRGAPTTVLKEAFQRYLRTLDGDMGQTSSS